MSNSNALINLMMHDKPRRRKRRRVGYTSTEDYSDDEREYRERKRTGIFGY